MTRPFRLRNNRERGNVASISLGRMNYLKTTLSVLGAIFLAELVPGPWSPFKGMSTEKATGLAAFAGGFIESLLSPLFWALALLFFFLFRWASKNQHTSVRVLLFWTPTVLFLAIAISFAALLAYVFLHLRRS